MEQGNKGPVKILIIEKNCEIKELNVKKFYLEELYKKCNFKKSDGFDEKCEWNVKIDNQHLYVKLYAKSTGKCNYENKYEFPPPVDNELYFGSCALVCYSYVSSEYKYLDLSICLWNKIYEKLFGGFEDLSSQMMEDEDEEDELDKIPKEKKTKTGYLKDGFVVDSDEDEKDNNSEVTEYMSKEHIYDKEDEDELEVGTELTEDIYDD
jgi:hypothetical protein